MTAISPPASVVPVSGRTTDHPAPRLHRASTAYYLAFAAVLVNLLDSWLFPAAGLNQGGIKAGGLRITDELCVLSLGFSLTVLLAGRLRVPRALGIPFFLMIWLWLQGLAIGIWSGHNGRVIFAECHVPIYALAICLAWLQAPPALIRRHETVLLPIAFVGSLSLLSSSSLEKGGDLSTIAAGIAAIALIQRRAVVSVPLALAAGALVVTGGQRAALLFSLPPLVFAAIIALTRSRWTRNTGATWSLVVAAGAGALALFSTRVAGFINSVYVDTFHRVGKVQSSGSRREQWTIAGKQIHESPFFGKGLGFRYQLYDPTTNTSTLTDITHNIYIDVAMRTGYVGVAILAAILILGAGKVWSIRGRITALQVTVSLILLGLLVHGAVESILDKPRLTLFASWMLATLLTSSRRNESTAR
jgi:hypothetical protein